MGHFLDRVSAEAKKTANWPLLLKVNEASRTLARGAAGRGSYPAAPSPLKSFIVGQNEEQAGQFASAVASYQEALKDTDDLVPLNIVRERLTGIRKDHAGEFEEGVQRALNPAVSYRYPPNYPPPGRPGFFPATPPPPGH